MKKILASSLIIIGMFSLSSSAENKLPVNYEEVDLQEHCYILSILIDTPQFQRDKGKPYLEDKLVINDQSAYSEFQKTASKARNMACKDAHFPPIDFSHKTLLGNWVSGSCAASGFEREVSKDEERKEVTYRVKVKERNVSCSGPGLQSINLIAVPKIPNGYKVIFVPAPDDHRGFQTYSYENGETVARDWWGKVVPRRTSPPPGGGVFDVKMGVQAKDLSLAERELMVESGGINIPLPELESKEKSGQPLTNREKTLLKKLHDAQALQRK